MCRRWLPGGLRPLSGIRKTPHVSLGNMAIRGGLWFGVVANWFWYQSTYLAFQTWILPMVGLLYEYFKLLMFSQLLLYATLVLCGFLEACIEEVEHYFWQKIASSLNQLKLKHVEVSKLAAKLDKLLLYSKPDMEIILHRENNSFFAFLCRCAGTSTAFCYFGWLFSTKLLRALWESPPNFSRRLRNGASSRTVRWNWDERAYDHSDHRRVRRIWDEFGYDYFDYPRWEDLEDWAFFFCQHWSLLVSRRLALCEVCSWYFMVCVPLGAFGGERGLVANRSARSMRRSHARPRRHHRPQPGKGEAKRSRVVKF